jgi:cytochrome c5
MTLRIASIFLLLVPLSVLIAEPRNSASPAKHSEQTSASTDHAQPPDPGERIFKTNCARCHTPPMSLPPRIAGTVLMHMRVRASLSQRDEQLLLRFIAP